jgi:hypothetical protein
MSKAEEYIPIDTIIKMADGGMTQTEIAKVVSCSPQNISARLSAVDYNGLKTLRDSKDKVFERLQWELAKSIEPADIKKMAVRDRFMGIGILEDKIRLLRGQSVGQDIQINVIQALGVQTDGLRSMLASLTRPQDVVFDASNNDTLKLECNDINDMRNIALSDKKHYDNHANTNDNDTIGENISVSQEAEPAQAQRRRGRPAKGR